MVSRSQDANNTRKSSKLRRGPTSWSFKYIITVSITIVYLLMTLIIAVLFIPNFGIQLDFLLLGRSIFADKMFTKGPMVQLIGDNRAMVIWENLEGRDTIFEWGNIRQTVTCMSILWDAKQTKTRLYREFVETIPGTTNYAIYPSIGDKQSFQLSIPPSPSSNNFRIVVIGDNQSGRRPFRSMLSSIVDEKPDVFLHLGDMVQLPYKYSDWQDYFFDPLQRTGLLSKLPFIIVQGNHDGRVTPYFPDPGSLFEGCTGHYYALTLGPARIIVMDTNIKDDKQIEWLERELKSERCQASAFRIVSAHVPPFIEYWNPTSWNIQNEKEWPKYIRERAVGLFEKYRVDIVISGHQHNYQRGKRNNVVYLISGGGGERLDDQQVENWEMYNKVVISHHYTLLDISDTTINITMKTDTGQIGDNYAIFRRNDV